MKLKKCIIILITLVLTFTMTLSAYGNEDVIFQESQSVVEPDGVGPLYVYIVRNSCELTISNNRASCVASVTGVSSISYVYIYMELQKYNTSSKSWVKYDSWQSVANDFHLKLTKTRTITSGKYRLKADLVANTEKITVYSAVKTK